MSCELVDKLLIFSCEMDIRCERVHEDRETSDTSDMSV